MRPFCRIVAVMVAAWPAACSIAQTPVSIERTVTLHLRNFAYDPPGFEMNVGESVWVELINDTDFSHYFGGATLREYVSYQSLTANIEVAPRSTKKVRVTAEKAGTATFTCFVPVHERQGMVGSITVTSGSLR